MHPEPKNHQLLFIGGAARSGTTLLLNLLDGHPSVFAYPLEAHTLLRYFRTKPDERRRYFQGPFIESRDEGQQAILANENLLEDYKRKIEAEFGTPFHLDVDCPRYLQEYRHALGTDVPGLDAVCQALLSALAAASPGARAHSAGANLGAFKLPYATEVFALRIASEIPGSRFLHILRHPHARYASWKKRLLRPGKGIDHGRQVCRRGRDVDFVTNIGEVTVSSFHRGILNRKRLGEDRYQMLKYENLVLRPEATMRRVADWLGLDYSAALHTPSRLGVPVASGSSFNPDSGISAANARRSRQYREITSSYERALHNWYLSLGHMGLVYDLNSDQTAPATSAWLMPFRNERRKDYIWRLLTRRARFGFNPKLTRERLSTRRLEAYLAPRD